MSEDSGNLNGRIQAKLQIGLTDSPIDRALGQFYTKNLMSEPSLRRN